ncbi:unnamed protein product, partial [Ectocarpus sp. 4 AP-2014]
GGAAAAEVVAHVQASKHPHPPGYMTSWEVRRILYFSSRSGAATCHKSRAARERNPIAYKFARTGNKSKRIELQPHSNEPQAVAVRKVPEESVHSTMNEYQVNLPSKYLRAVGMVHPCRRGCTM